jgi:hypothetical protein
LKVSKPGFRPLVTQLYFRDDPYNAADPFVKESLIVEPARSERDGREAWAVDFDLVLEPGGSAEPTQDADDGSRATPRPSAGGREVVQDTDGDGLPDEYEARHDCLDPAVDEAVSHTFRAGGTEWVGLPGGEDADHDGIMNLEEYRRGTDPCHRAPGGEHE